MEGSRVAACVIFFRKILLLKPRIKKFLTVWYELWIGWLV